MNIIFRVNSHKNIGAGHAMRCIALAEEFQRNNYTVIFISNYHLEFVNKIIKEKNIVLKKILECPVEKEIVKIIEILKQYKNNYLILDGYNFDYEYQKLLKKQNIKITYITDYADKYHCDILVCPTPGLKPSDFKSEIKTNYLLGPKYVFLRDEILNCKPKRNTPLTIKNILVCFGASFFDINIIKNFINAFEEIFTDKQISFVIGVNKNTHPLNDLTTSKKNNYLFLSAKEFSIKKMRETDLAFAPASTMFWELNCLKIATILFYVSNNQKGNAEWLEKNNIAGSLGNIKNISFKNLKHIISAFYNNLLGEYKISKIVDNKGKKLIFRNLKPL